MQLSITESIAKPEADTDLEHPARLPFDMVDRLLLKRLSKGASLPSWQKLALYCWANCDRRGHCPVPTGELGKVIAKGSQPVAAHEVRRAVKRAISEGWIDPVSSDRCLVVPHGITYGAGKYKSRSVCEHH